MSEIRTSPVFEHLQQVQFTDDPDFEHYPKSGRPLVRNLNPYNIEMRREDA